jgi:hypothetical protein
MEQPQRRMRKHNLMLIRRLDALLIHNTPTRRRKVPHPALPCTMHIIREREERIARTRNPIQLTRPLPLFLLLQRWHLALEQALPLFLLPALQHFSADEQVDAVGFICAFYSFFEGESKDAWVVAEPPEIGFPACETGTVDARLLACPDADDGSMEGVCDAVGLCIFQSECRDDEVCDCA